MSVARDSTYVRTIVCINNTYIHTYRSDPNTLNFGGIGFRENNAYYLSGVHTAGSWEVPS